MYSTVQYSVLYSTEYRAQLLIGHSYNVRVMYSYTEQYCTVLYLQCTLLVLYECLTELNY